MKTLKGIDVSTFQGDVNWGRAKSSIDFAIIRGGFGRNIFDDCALNNIKGCQAHEIPFGLYWFSYALSVANSVKEADYACDMADKYKITMPVIGYDWEEDSDDYARRHGVEMTAQMRLDFAVAFCERVKARGYIPLLYINYSDLSIGFDTLAEKYDVWFSCPGGSEPNVSNMTIWQYSWTGRIPGIYADVDMNYCYKDYTSGAPAPTPTPTPTKKEKTVNLTFNYLGRNYVSPTGQTRTVQRILNACNYKGADGKKLAEDGVFGVNTEYAVKAYQTKHKLAVDGVVGAATWKALTGAK